ncbi:Resolvase, N terminal domain [Seinonella peptonophila]|uniref:Resolvase, N terminal domain n=2 Tax=Seinonella peptonophila TaxID=112248 RepID=A0A1M4YAE9_9BACL|nr:Resolvase, N terminal domain [Seinonella peptonophila]
MRFAYFTPTAYKNVDRALEILRTYKCDKIIFDQSTSINESRPKLLELFNSMQPGDTLILPKLDQVGLTTPHFLGFLDKLFIRRIRLICLAENIDTKDLVTQNLIQALIKMDTSLKKRLDQESGPSTYAEENGIDIESANITGLFNEVAKFESYGKVLKDEHEASDSNESDHSLEDLTTSDYTEEHIATNSALARQLYKRKILGGNDS